MGATEEGEGELSEEEEGRPECVCVRSLYMEKTVFWHFFKTH